MSMILNVDRSILGIVVGVVAGLIRAVLGYLNRPEGEEIKGRALARTFIVSALTGLTIVNTTAVNLGDPTAALLTVMSTMGVDFTVKEAKDALTKATQ